VDKNYLIKLTTNLYRLTLLFPKKEPLRYKMRELADGVLAKSILILGVSSRKSKNLILELEKELEILDSYFTLAKNQNWVSPYDVLEIQKEYSKIKDKIIGAGEASTENKEIEDKKTEAYGMQPIMRLRTLMEWDKKTRGRPSRQQKILKVLKEREKVQVGELKKVFPYVTKRTLRRDFDFLLKKGVVERIGEKNGTFYQLKR